MTKQERFEALQARWRKTKMSRVIYVEFKREWFRGLAVSGRWGWALRGFNLPHQLDRLFMGDTEAEANQMLLMLNVKRAWAGLPLLKRVGVQQMEVKS